MPDKGNDTGARMKHATRASFKHEIPAKTHFGTPEEIADRVGGSLRSMTDNHPTVFKQIGPDAGGDFTAKKPSSRSGDSKFGNPRKYA